MKIGWLGGWGVSLEEMKAIVDVAKTWNTYVAAPHNTWCLHLQAQDDLLLVIHNKDTPQYHVASISP